MGSVLFIHILDEVFGVEFLVGKDLRRFKLLARLLVAYLAQFLVLSIPWRLWDGRRSKYRLFPDAVN
jgi:hypothetical protein